jgi:3-oxoacyl-[acyl-carrier protein] reductase
MDLGIADRRAIVCGASKGLGRAVAMSLAADGVEVLIAARNAEQLEATAKEIGAATGHAPKWIAADVTTEAGRAALLDACPQPDILINNAGGPPPGDFRKLTRDDWIKALDANMLSAIDLIQKTLDGMVARRFGRIVCITSHMVKSPASILSLSNGARAGLTGFVGGIARDVAQYNVTLNNVLPGQFDTDRLRGGQIAAAAARAVDLEVVRADAARQIPARRFGDAAEFGATCAFLCSAHAGFITGQNVLIDGGQFPGLL